VSAAIKGRLAVALRYDPRSSGAAPRVVAKGRGEIGQAIIDTAREHGVPLKENAPLAEALSQVELDDQIPETLYRAVAEVLAFILRTSGHLKG
jgi:flagellar biosynthesis protein